MGSDDTTRRYRRLKPVDVGPPQFTGQPGSGQLLDAESLRQLIGEPDPVLAGMVDREVLKRELEIVRALLALSVMRHGHLLTSRAEVAEVKGRGRFSIDVAGNTLLLRYEEGI